MKSYIFDETFIMKTKLILLVLLFYCSNFSISQSFHWVKSWGYQVYGQIGQIYAEDVATDEIGNSYIVSSGTTQVDFDPSGAIITAPTAGCGSVSKFDSNGSLVWVKFITPVGTAGSCRPERIFYKNGSLVIVGSYGGNYDFNTSPTITNSLSGGGNFVTKWDVNGNFDWVKFLSGSNSTVSEIDIDVNNNIYLTGSFSTTISISGAGAVTSNGNLDIFICKLDANGNGQWLYGYGSIQDDQGYGIATSLNGEVYFTGIFSNTVDFNPTVNNDYITAVGGYDIFFQKIGNDGTVIWTEGFGSLGTDYGTGVVIDTDDNIFLSGVINGPVDFDISTTNSILNAPSSDCFVTKFNPDCGFIWAKLFAGSGGTSNSSYSPYIAIDTNNSIYLSGSFQGTVDFNPNGATNNLTSSSNSGNTFIVKLYNDGSYSYSGALNGTSSYGNWPNGIAVGVSNIFIAGAFKGVVDFNPDNTVTNNLNSATNSSNVPDYSAYVLKLNQCIPTSASIDEQSCSVYQAPDGQIFTQSGTYLSVIANSSGCDSLITINLTIDLSTTSSINETSCGDYTAPDGQVYTQSGSYTAVIPNVAGCDSTISISLTIPTFDVTVSQTGATLTANASGQQYQWIDCATDQNINGATSQSYTAASNGQYAVIVGNGTCGDTSSCLTVSGLGFEDLSITFEVYPNPAQSSLYVKTTVASPGDVRIIDLNGRVLIEQKVDDLLTTIDISSLSPGSYFVQIGENIPIQFQKK